MAASIIISALYFWLIYDDLKATFQITVKGTAMSFGANVLWMLIEEKFGSPLSSSLMRMISYGMAALLVILAIAMTWSRGMIKTEGNDSNIDSFRLGGWIYIGTFLLGNNFDYKLIFLLFTIPQLVNWVSSDDIQVRWISKITLVAIITSLWSFILMPIIKAILSRGMGVIIDEAANWMVFAGVLYLLVRSIPEWLPQMFMKHPNSGELSSYSR
jgi:hypothetical protein